MKSANCWRFRHKKAALRDRLRERLSGRSASGTKSVVAASGFFFCFELVDNIHRPAQAIPDAQGLGKSFRSDLTFNAGTADLKHFRQISHGVIVFLGF